MNGDEMQYPSSMTSIEVEFNGREMSLIADLRARELRLIGSDGSVVWSHPITDEVRGAQQENVLFLAGRYFTIASSDRDDYLQHPDNRVSDFLNAIAALPPKEGEFHVKPRPANHSIATSRPTNAQKGAVGPRVSNQQLILTPSKSPNYWLALLVVGVLAAAGILVYVNSNQGNEPNYPPPSQSDEGPSGGSNSRPTAVSQYCKFLWIDQITGLPREANMIVFSDGHEEQRGFC